ncbi:hypothetical protein [Salinarimonas sp.]|uniref:hypothetical protein n=1 Tax=Salinarimonas sp. TaxID=2766526 RepID=UPI0032D8EA0B
MMSRNKTQSPRECAPDLARLAQTLRRFVAERLATFAGSEERHDPKVAARTVAELTRCLRELVALERSLGAKPADAEGETDEPDADLGAGAAPRLADLVAGEVERLHERQPAGGDLERV